MTENNAHFLFNRLTAACRNNANLASLLFDPFIKDVLGKTRQTWREVVALATLNGIPVPAISASLGCHGAEPGPSAPDLAAIGALVASDCTLVARRPGFVDQCSRADARHPTFDARC